MSDRHILPLFIAVMGTLLLISIDSVHAIGWEPDPTYFDVTIIDKSNGLGLEGHAFVTINVTKSDDLPNGFKTHREINGPEARVDAPLFYPTLPDGTMVSITVKADDYMTSKPFLYVVKEDGPKEGLLFTHTFELEPLSQAGSNREVITEQHQISFENTSFIITTQSSSQISDVNFSKDDKMISIQLVEDSSQGMLFVHIPKDFVSGPYIVKRDSILLHSFQASENFTHSSISLDYDSGDHDIQIIGTNVVPEFPLVTVGIISAIALGLLVAFGRTKLMPKGNSIL